MAFEVSRRMGLNVCAISIRACMVGSEGTAREAIVIDNRDVQTRGMTALPVAFCDTKDTFLSTPGFELE